MRPASKIEVAIQAASMACAVDIQVRNSGSVNWVVKTLLATSPHHRRRVRFLSANFHASHHDELQVVELGPSRGALTGTVFRKSITEWR